MESKQLTQAEILNKLYTEHGLAKEDVHIQESRGRIMFKIIKRSGIDKIQSNLGITINLEKISDQLIGIAEFRQMHRVAFLANGQRRIKQEDGTVNIITDQSTGEADELSVKQEPKYLFAMAEKRAKARVILKLAGLYEEGFFSEDEADEFKEAVRGSNKRY